MRESYKNTRTKIMYLREEMADNRLQIQKES